MNKGSLIDNLLGIVERAEKAGPTPAKNIERSDESKTDIKNEGENHNPNSSLNRLV
jgi:hypothetical protein